MLEITLTIPLTTSRDYTIPGQVRLIKIDIVLQEILRVWSKLPTLICYRSLFIKEWNLTSTKKKVKENVLNLLILAPKNKIFHQFLIYQEKD